MSLTKVFLCNEQGCEKIAVSRKQMHVKGWCEIEPINQDVHYCTEHHPLNYMEIPADDGKEDANV